MFRISKVAALAAAVAVAGAVVLGTAAPAQAHNYLVQLDADSG